MTTGLTSARVRQLKARAQHLEPICKVGKSGLSDAFLQSVRDALSHHELVKVKFTELTEKKKELAPVLAERTGSQVVMQVGNVVVLFREKPTPAAP